MARTKVGKDSGPPPEVSAAIIAAVDRYLAAEGIDGLTWRVSISPRPEPAAGAGAAWSAAGRRGQMESRMRMDWRKGSGR